MKKPLKKPQNMVLDAEHAKLLLGLTDEEAGKIIKALVAFVHTQALPETLSGVLLYCCQTLLDDIKQYQAQQAALSERNRQRSMKRWGMPRESAGTHGTPRESAGIHGTPRESAGSSAAPQAARHLHDDLMTGEDGEPIVIYRHG